MQDQYDVSGESPDDTTDRQLSEDSIVAVTPDYHDFQKEIADSIASAGRLSVVAGTNDAAFTTALATINSIEVRKAEALIQKESREAEEELKARQIANKAAELANDSLKRDIETRRIYAIFLLGVLALSIVLQYALLACVGLGWFNFKAYPTLLHFVVVENFAQVIGIILIVVNYLFPGSRMKNLGGKQGTTLAKSKKL